MFKYDSFTDAELQCMSSEGDKVAQDVLIRRYLLKVRVCARRFFLLGGDNDDLIQEGTIGLLTAIRNYSESSGASFGTYAEHCINSRLIDAIRFNGYRPFISADELVSGDDIPGPCSDPEEQYIQEEQYLELITELKSVLSKFESKVFDLYINGASYSEIAEFLGKTSQSIYNAVQRIRQKLSALYNNGEFSISCRK